MQCSNCQTELPEASSRCSHCGSATNVSLATAAAYKSSFGEQFNAALILWKMNLGDLAVLTLVLMLVIWIPIANIGFIAGYTRSVLKVARGEGRAEVGDIFGAWDCFGNLLVYMVLLLIAAMILGVVPVFGALASAALAFAAFPGFYRIIDRAENFMDAGKWSLKAIQARPVDWLLSYLIGGFIAGLGSLLLFIGIILSLPLGLLIVIQQYENSKSL